MDTEQKQNLAILAFWAFTCAVLIIPYRNGTIRPIIFWIYVLPGLIHSYRYYRCYHSISSTAS